MIPIPPQAIKYALKFGVYAIAGIAVIWMCWYVYSSVYDDGREYERLIWQEKEFEASRQASVLLAQARQKAKEESTLQNEKLMEVINAKQESISNLSNSMRRMANSRMYVNAKTARKDSGSSSDKKRKNTEPSSGAANRIELSEETKRNIRRDYNDAQSVVDQYQACRIMLSSVAEVVHLKSKGEVVEE